MENNWNQLIERYLNGELSVEGKEAFELELTKNKALQQELELHQLTQNLIKRSAMRTIVAQRGKFHHLKKTITNATIIVLAVAAITTAVLLSTKSSKSPSESEQTDEVIEQVLLDKMNEELQFENIDPQYFKFTGENDIFLSESGVLLSITDHSFLFNGKPYQGEAIVQWQEAQKASEIVKAGLSTMSGDNLLETQGMFSLNAFTPEGKQLELSNTGVYVQVPVSEQKDGMMLFQGVKGNNGKVDWQNPAEMEQLPVPKSMVDMNLFPPKYEPKLNELKWFTDKTKRDSLYLSFDEKIEIGLDSISSENGTDPFNSFEPKEPTLNNLNQKNDVPTITDNPFSGLSSVSLMGFGKLKDSFTTPENQYLATTVSQPQVEYPEDKVRLKFFIEKIKGTNDAYVVAQIAIANQWMINTVQVTKGYSGIPTRLILEKNSDYTLLGDPIEPSPTTIIDNNTNEQIIYHTGEIIIKQKIRINNPNGSVLGNFSYQTCKFNSHCLPPYEAYLILPLNENHQESTNFNRKRHIPPSKVLAIWNTKFDKTILATQDFEKRMKAIHNTCDERVFDIYVSGINESLWKLDEKVVKLGYPEFQKFADERVGKLNLSNEHQQNLKAFYDHAIKTIRSKGKNAALAAIKKDNDWDNALNKERTQEIYRKGVRESQNLNDEYALNLANVCKQLGKKKCFTMKGRNTKTNAKKAVPSNIVNIDRLVMNATVNRQTTNFRDAKTGKTAKLTYEAFSVEVADAKKFDKLFVYLFSKEINSYQRLDLVNGKLTYNLNGDLNYTAVIVSINEDGYFINELGDLKPIDLGTLTLEEVSETEFDNRINAINAERTSNPMEIQSELDWLFKEKANYNVQKQRRENAAFRALVRPTIYVCGDNTEATHIVSHPQIKKEQFFK